MFTSSLAGHLPSRLDVSVPLADQINRLFEALQGIGPLRKGGIESALFASIQIAETVDLGELRWNFQQVQGQDRIAISPVVVQSPLLWVRGGVQADFICAAN